MIFGVFGVKGLRILPSNVGQSNGQGNGKLHIHWEYIEIGVYEIKFEHYVT